MFTKKKKTEATDSREVILQTASRLFAEKGFEAVSIRELSKEANVNIAMIAYHFGSKEGLFKAIIGDKIPKMAAQLKNIQKSEGTAWDKISAIIDIYIERMFNNGVFNKLVFRELSLEQRPEHRETILAGVEGNWKIVKTFIEEGQKNGLFKSDIDAELTMASLFSTIFLIVNTPCIAARMMNEKDEKIMFSETNKTRLRQHLKSMMRAHLFINQTISS